MLTLGRKKATAQGKNAATRTCDRSPGLGTFRRWPSPSITVIEINSRQRDYQSCDDFF